MSKLHDLTLASWRGQTCRVELTNGQVLIGQPRVPGVGNPLHPDFAITLKTASRSIVLRLRDVRNAEPYPER